MITTATKKAAQAIIEQIESGQAEGGRGLIDSLIADLGGNPDVIDMAMPVEIKLMYVMALVVRNAR